MCRSLRARWDRPEDSELSVSAAITEEEPNSNNRCLDGCSADFSSGLDGIKKPQDPCCGDFLPDVSQQVPLQENPVEKKERSPTVGSERPVFSLLTGSPGVVLLHKHETHHPTSTQLLKTSNWGESFQRRDDRLDNL